MAISPVDHKTLIVGYGQHVPGSTTGIAGLWNTATREYHRLSQRNERPIFCLAASRDGRLLALGGGQLGAQGFVQVWDMRVTQLLWTMPIGKTPVWSVAFSADGSRLVSGEWDNRLTFWDVSAGQPRRTLNLESFAATCMALSPDGMTLAIGGGNFSQGDIVLWDVASDTKRITLRGHGSVVWSLDFSRDGKLLASGGWDSAVKLWDMDTLQELQNCAGHTIHVQAVCFSPDGATLASGSLDSTVKLWHVNTGEELATLKAPAPVTSVLFFPDGRTLAAGCQDRSVKLWHTDAEEVVLRPE
jgi:WD40 repeat protein